MKRIVNRLLRFADAREAPVIFHGVRPEEAAKRLELGEGRVEIVSAERLLHLYEPLRQVCEVAGVKVRSYLARVGETVFYVVEEPPVNDTVRRLVSAILNIASLSEARDPQELAAIVARVVGETPAALRSTWELRSALYYAANIVFYGGPLAPLLADPYIEDVSAMPGYKFYVADKEAHGRFGFEHIPANILPDPLDSTLTPIYWDEMIHVIAAKGGKGLSGSTPIVETKLDVEREHRLVAFNREISKASGFILRKHSTIVYPITKLIADNMLSPAEAALLIYTLKHRRFILVVGEPGSGKTTLMQAILLSLPYTEKIVTAEDLPELHLTSHPGWQPLYTRRAYGEEVADIDLERLLELSLRARPTVLAVGEALSPKVFAVLAQAAAVGIGAISTFHSKSPQDVFSRLLSMNIPTDLLQTITFVVYVSRSYIAKTSDYGRRLRRIYEITNVTRDAFEYTIVGEWDPAEDRHWPDRRLAEIIEVYRRSRALKEIGANLYGERDAPRVVVDILLLTRELEKLVEDEVFDARLVSKHLAEFITWLVSEGGSRRLWEKWRERILAAISS